MVKINRSSSPRQVKDILSTALAAHKIQPEVKNHPVNNFTSSIDSSLRCSVDPVDYIANTATVSDLLWLNELLKRQVKHPNQVYGSFERMGEQLGRSDKTFKRAADKFCKAGLVSRKTGGYNVANVYKFHPLFANHSFRSRLVHYLPALKYIPAFMLLNINLLSSVQDVNVPAIRERSELRSNSNRESISKTTDAHTRTKGSGPASFFQKDVESQQAKAKKRMQDSETAVNAIRTLKLTVWGKIVLCAYPAAAIRYADDQLFDRKQEPKNPLGLFKDLCQKYCEANKIIPDWERVNQLKMTVPWDFGHNEVSENVIHQSAAKNAALLKSAKDYKPGKEWGLSVQKKEILKPPYNPELHTIRQPDWRPTAAQLAGENINKDNEMQAAYEAMIAKGRVNAFTHFLQRKVEKLEADVKNTINSIHGDVEQYEELKSIPVDYKLMAELEAMCDEIDDIIV
jgi:hypothetical protein